MADEIKQIQIPIDIFSTSNAGLVPSPSTTSHDGTKFLTADGNWSYLTYSKITGAILWTNASPTSSFAAQTVTLTIPSYSFNFNPFSWSTSQVMAPGFFLVVYYHYAGSGSSTYCYANVAQDELSTPLYAKDDSGNGYNGIRYVTVSGSAMTATFSACTYNGSTNNARIIPWKIYGFFDAPKQ